VITFLLHVLIATDDSRLRGEGKFEAVEFLVTNIKEDIWTNYVQERMENKK